MSRTTKIVAFVVLLLACSESPTAPASYGSGGLRLDSGAERPTCTAALRGTIYLDLGDTGERDFLLTCLRNEAGAYTWAVAAVPPYAAPPGR